MSRALTAETVERVREARYMDGLTIAETMRVSGVSAWAVNKYAPGRPGKVPVGPVREVFLASGVSACAVAADLGWLVKGSGDSSRLRRRLGINREVWGHGDKRGFGFARTIDAEVAGLIAEACGQPAWSVLPDEDEVAA